MQKINQKRNLFPLFLYICPEPVAIKDQAMANGTLIHKWDFHAGDTQIWDIELYNGGSYYTITSTAPETSGFYLGTVQDTATEYVLVILRSGTVTDGMLWRIEKQSSGNFKIKSKLQPYPSQELVMAVSWSENQSADGLQIKALLYSNDDYNTDEWFFESMYRSIKVIHYYDNGLVAPFCSSCMEELSPYVETCYHAANVN